MIQESATTSDDGRPVDARVGRLQRGAEAVRPRAGDRRADRAAPGPRLPLVNVPVEVLPRPPEPSPTPSPSRPFAVAGPLARTLDGGRRPGDHQAPAPARHAARAVRRLRAHGPQRRGDRGAGRRDRRSSTAGDRPHRERQGEQRELRRPGTAGVPHRHPRTGHPRPRSRAGARHHGALSGEPRRGGSSTRETRLRNNFARARVRVVVVGEPRDGCASGARVGDGRAGLGARASRC